MHSDELVPAEEVLVVDGVVAALEEVVLDGVVVPDGDEAAALLLAKEGAGMRND